MNPSRRSFIVRTALATAGISKSWKALGEITDRVPNLEMAAPGALTLNIFSKHLQWLDYSAMASAVAEIGFEGIDLTVRPEGHILPERVHEDLPKAVETIRNAGLNVFMITTSIASAEDPFAETILKTASSLGISYYRTGWISYDEKMSMVDNLKRIQGQLTQLAALNKKYAIRGQYQNHYGANFGSPLWDLWTVLKAIDSPWVGSQYDILHATVEGANSWPLGLKLLKSYIGTMDIKDFHWAKKEGKWISETTPLGEGMVDLKRYFSLLKEYAIQGPFSVHYEYPLGGAQDGAKVITVEKKVVLSAMKKDLVTLKRLLSEAGLK
jgi:L-ribulose-5-phosphate 3-epimerase